MNIFNIFIPRYTNTIPDTISNISNAYYISRIVLQNYNIAVPYTNIVNTQILYPALMLVIKHKIIVLLILAFI
jgi:hypothetical protein